MNLVVASGGAPSTGAIELIGVEKAFDTDDGPVRALARTDFSVRRGEFAVLPRPFGLRQDDHVLRLFAGPRASIVRQRPRERPQSVERGSGRDESAVADMGVVFQDANLFPWLTVEDNIALPLKLRGVSKSERRARARALCALVDITGFEKRHPRELSGGMRQRASIARALSYNPDILLMDEPFGALDAITRDMMNIELQRIWLETSKTILLVTHSISEAVFLADRVALLSQRPGRIQEVIEVPFARPRDVAVQSAPEFLAIVEHLRSRLEH